MEKFGNVRIGSPIALGTIFCWLFFKWLVWTSNTFTAWIGFLLVSFLPSFIELSSEVRQYALLLCFLIAATYVFEGALAAVSGGKMLFSFLFLYLAMLTHFSGILFAGTIGVYSLWRMASAHFSRQVIAIWIAGQAGALGLVVFLYRTQISNLRVSAAAQHMQVLLGTSYFHWGHDHLLQFIFARTFGVLQYTFGQLVVGDIAGVLFIAGLVVLLSEERGQKEPGGSPHQLGTFLLLPFTINCAAAIMDLYPYGGTRHSAFLMPFAIAGVSLGMTKLTRQRWPLALSATLLILIVCQVFGVPHRPYMRREDQRSANMIHAIDAIRHQVSPADIIFVDFQTNFLLRFYFCPDVVPDGSPASSFRTYSCGGYRVISTNSETNILTVETFSQHWNEMVSTYSLKPGQTVWIFQAGWDIGLAQELQRKIPKLHDLERDFFGRNISLFKLSVGSFANCAITRTFAAPIKSVKLTIVSGTADDIGYVGDTLVTPNSFGTTCMLGRVLTAVDVSPFFSNFSIRS